MNSTHVAEDQPTYSPIDWQDCIGMESRQEITNSHMSRAPHLQVKVDAKLY